jgi:uncharacterized membrane protein YdjX (TVP38/TMEM64 family)
VPDTDTGSRWTVRRFLPILVIAALIGLVYAMGWHRELSLTTLVKHRSIIDSFVAEHRAAAIAVFIGIYIVAATLSLPAGAVLTTTAGFLFGTLTGALAAMVGATAGATAIFLIARTAIGEHLFRRAGPFVAKLAEGFRNDAFSYLLFLRLVPFPFWLVNLAPAFFGVRLSTFLGATVLGIIPATFAFAFLGAGLDSAIAAQERLYRACVASGRTDCRVELDPSVALTPELMAALAVMVVVGVVPLVVKRLKARSRAASRPGVGGSTMS